MRVNYDEEVTRSSPNGEREKEQRVKSRETQQTAQNGESLTASTLSQFTHTLKKRKLHTPQEPVVTGTAVLKGRTIKMEAPPHVVRFKDSIAIQVSEKKKPQAYCK